MKINRRTQVC